MPTESFWSSVHAWFVRSPRAVELLPPTSWRVKRVVAALGLPSDSPVAQVAAHTGGILVDRGWVRILGSGADRMGDDLANWNGQGPASRFGLPGARVVALDVLGGVFALDEGVLGRGDGEAYYLSPDSLGWEGMGFGYAGLLEFLLTGDLAGFYGAFRWTGWEKDVAPLPVELGLYSYPPLWSKEGKDPSRVSRKAVPMSQLVRVTLEYAHQLQKSAWPSASA